VCFEWNSKSISLLAYNVIQSLWFITVDVEIWLYLDQETQDSYSGTISKYEIYLIYSNIILCKKINSNM
jgi:hypothetical protein